MEKIPTVIESPSDKIGRLIKEVMGRIDILEFQEKMTAFAEQISKKHPDYKRYQCYHKLIISTPPERADIEEDFEGEDSVAGFLEGLLKTKTQL